MIRVPLITVEKIAFALGDGSRSLADLAREAVRNLDDRDFGGVIVATFSNPERFPALSVRLVAELGLPAETPAFDVQMACSAYPYAVYLAGRLAADTGCRILVVNGDIQSPLVDANDHATGHIFSDAVTASVISCNPTSSECSFFDFLSCADEALQCAAEGPIKMDGMKVFTFVATEVRTFLKDFLATLGQLPLHLFSPPQPLFVPHQANPYMVRQLAKALGLENELLTLDEKIKNPGSCSIPLTLAKSGKSGLAVIAGFGAGYSASVGLIRVQAVQFGS